MQREIASKGGRSVPPEERSFSKDRALAAEAGRKGGEASHGGRRAAGAQPPDTGTAGRAPSGIDPEGGNGGTASGGDRTGGSGRKEGSR